MSQSEQEDSQQIGIMHQANEWKQKLSMTMYVMSFMVGLLIIITSYIIIKAVFDYVGLWATILIIAIIAIIVARKL